MKENPKQIQMAKAQNHRRFGHLGVRILRLFRIYLISVVLFSLIAAVCGCGEGSGGLGGYSNEVLFPENVDSIYVEMFDNKSFRRGVEYELTDALAKRIEAETPYKITSSRDRADTVISGYITSVGGAVLVTERETGRALEKEVRLEAVVSWKNLKTGRLLINSESVGAAASYSEWQNQTFDYAATLAANNLAQRIVELMERQW